MQRGGAAGPISVLIVDDHPVVRTGLRALLGGAPQVAVVGEAADGLAAVEEATRCQPDVILMDLWLPRLSGGEASRRILATQPRVGIVVLSGPGSESEVLAAVAAGVQGYLDKTATRDEYLEAIRRVAGGEVWLPPKLATRLLDSMRSRSAGTGVEALTRREQEVLELLARGSDNRAIAQHLDIAEITVRTHVSHVFAKLGVNNRVEAVLCALRAGLVRLYATETPPNCTPRDPLQRLSSL